MKHVHYALSLLACRIFLLAEAYIADNPAKELTAQKGEIVEVTDNFISSLVKHYLANVLVQAHIYASVRI